MITAEKVNGIVRFQANGLPVVSLYCRVDPGGSQREVRARVDSLLDQIRPLAKDRDLDHRYRLSVRADIERIRDALGSERWPPGTIAIFSCSGRDLYEEIPLPRRVREQVMVDCAAPPSGPRPPYRPGRTGAGHRLLLLPHPAMLARAGDGRLGKAFGFDARHLSN